MIACITCCLLTAVISSCRRRWGMRSTSRQLCQLVGVGQVQGRERLEASEAFPCSNRSDENKAGANGSGFSLEGNVFNSLQNIRLSEVRFSSPPKPGHEGVS